MNIAGLVIDSTRLVKYLTVCLSTKVYFHIGSQSFVINLPNSLCSGKFSSEHKKFLILIFGSPSVYWIAFQLDYCLNAFIVQLSICRQFSTLKNQPTGDEWWKYQKY